MLQRHSSRNKYRDFQASTIKHIWHPRLLPRPLDTKNKILCCKDFGSNDSLYLGGAGKLKVPVGRGREPVGRDLVPVGRGTVPVGRGRVPVGADLVPVGRGRVPVGRGKLKLPLGSEKLPVGNAPPGKLLEPDGT